MEEGQVTREERLDFLNQMLKTRGWQEIVKPALLTAIQNNTDKWLSGSRAESEAGLTDESLKERIRALRWVLEWEKTKQALVDELQQMEELAMQTEPASEGGGPY